MAEGKRGKARQRPTIGPQRKAKQTGETKGLSRTAKNAKWIESVEEHEDRKGQTLATRSHDVIKHWAEERKAEPAMIAGTEHEGRPGVLRFDFEGYQEIPRVSWDDWFKTFDQRDLVFLFQEHLKKGNQSNFFKLDNPRREHE